jgi:hypothetical protein
MNAGTQPSTLCLPHNGAGRIPPPKVQHLNSGGGWADGTSASTGTSTNWLHLSTTETSTKVPHRFSIDGDMLSASKGKVPALEVVLQRLQPGESITPYVVASLSLEVVSALEVCQRSRT